MLIIALDMDYGPSLRSSYPIASVIRIRVRRLEERGRRINGINDMQECTKKKHSAECSAVPGPCFCLKMQKQLRNRLKASRLDLGPA